MKSRESDRMSITKHLQMSSVGKRVQIKWDMPMQERNNRGQFHRAAKQRKLLTRNICLADFLGYQPNLHVKLMYFGW